jgi:hypothetical protein
MNGGSFYFKFKFDDEVSDADEDTIGAEGRTRTDTRVAPQQFLRLPRLPFRHFGLFGKTMVPRPRIELGTRRFSVYCSTD